MTIDQLLAAFIARDRARLPLAPDVRYTENGQTLRLGDGLWGTLTGYAGQPEPASTAPRYRIDFANARDSEAVYFGGTLETTTPGMMALRMKSRGGQITEIEVVAVREENPGERGGTVTLFQPALLTHFSGSGFAQIDAQFLEATAPTGSGSHAELLDAVDRYLDAVERNDSRGVAFTADCQRRDNGERVTGNATAAPLDEKMPGYRPFALSCAAQIDSGFFQRIARVRGRRHIAVDGARGLVLTVALFDQPGSVAEIEVPGIGRVALPSGIRPEDLAGSENAAQFYVKRYLPNFRVPMTELTVQLTKVQQGRIARIESISRGAPYGLGHGWV